tara:strand:- start:737 stop:973 length:237 start_codon:yes stop_codon:yes gene_type:complete
MDSAYYDLYPMEESMKASLEMYKITFQSKDGDKEPFSIWRLAKDAEDACWQAGEIQQGSNWKLLDVELDDKEKTTLLP